MMLRLSGHKMTEYNNLLSLARLEKGARGIVRRIDESLLPKNVELEKGELERRILEIGIIENIQIEVLHFGMINRDPLVIQIGSGMTVAIRRNESEIILVELIK